VVLFFLFLFFFLGPAEGAGDCIGTGLLGTGPTVGGRRAVVMSACDGSTGLAIEISLTMRSFFTSAKEGNNFWHLRMVPM
jgi:hypothetical protein